MANFTGQLRSNELFQSIFNMIISQEVFADNFADNFRLVDKAKVDGSLYGDTKLYYGVDILESKSWAMDSAEATNVLELHRPEDPKVQAIYIDTFRQVALTADSYISKRAWSTEGAFTSFNSVIKGMVSETKKIYEATLYNAFIGTVEGNTSKQNIEWDISTDVGSATGMEAAKLEATSIGRRLADLITELKDYSSEFNDWKKLRSYSEDRIHVIWNSSIYNKIRKVDLPTIFHKEGIVDKFDGDVLPSRYFGQVNTTTGTTTSTNTNIRSLIETKYEVASANADPRAKLNPKDNKYYVHVFAGDLLPNEVNYAANATYTEDSDIICKVFVKLPPMMSAFSTATSFFNSRNLSENFYLTWGHNTLQHLYNYPAITIHKD